MVCVRDKVSGSGPLPGSVPGGELGAVRCVGSRRECTVELGATTGGFRGVIPFMATDDVRGVVGW